MTQEELDRSNKAQDDGADGSAMKAALEGNTEFLDVLRDVITSDAKQDDPEVRAKAIMDDATARILDLHDTMVTGLTERGTMPDTYEGMEQLVESFAGRLMFSQNPAGIAYALALLVKRYRDLLNDWAILYLAARGEDLDLESTTSPEMKVAAENVRDDQKEHPTGMYL